MFIAQVNTGSFDWVALAETKAEVEALLISAYDKHCETHLSADPTLMRNIVEFDEAWILPISVGTVYRDDTAILTPEV